jgi:hypothetical protein
MKIRFIAIAIALAAPCGITRGATGDGAGTDAAYEQMVNGLIAVNYYNEYLQEIIVDARHYLAEGLTEAMERLDQFVSAGKYDGASPVFTSNWRNAKEILSLPTRVPNWYAPADLKLFKGGIDQIRKDTDELLKMCEELQKYFQYNGGWKEDKCGKYTSLKPRMKELVASVGKSTAALDRRALEMAVAGEKLYWARDKALGYFVRAMKADVDNVHAIEALIKNPALQKEGNADAAATLPKIEKILAELKKSLEENTTLSTPALTEDLKKKKDRFYSYWIKKIVEDTGQHILPGLQKGLLTADDIDRVRADYIGRAYDEFITIYTYDGGVAIKYRRP